MARHVAGFLLIAAACGGELPTAPKDFGIRVRLVGTVRNAATADPLSGAQLAVTQNSTVENTTSFNDGRYLILSSDLREGDVRIEVRATGFHPFTATLRVVEGRENTYNVGLTALQ